LDIISKQNNAISKENDDVIVVGKSVLEHRDYPNMEFTVLKGVELPCPTVDRVFLSQTVQGDYPVGHRNDTQTSSQ
jgi:hypothetical protein